MIYAARTSTHLGIVEAAQARTAAAVLGLIQRGMSRERAHAKIGGRWGDIQPPPPPAPIAPPIAHPAIRTVYAVPAIPYDVHVVAWQAETARRASRQRVGIVDTILQPPAAAIIGIVSEAMAVAIGSMIGASQARRHTDPRKIAVALCRKWTAQSEPGLGRIFNRDASSIHSAANDIARAVKEDGRVAAAFARCDAIVRARFPKAAFRSTWGSAEAGRARLARTRAQAKGAWS